LFLTFPFKPSWMEGGRGGGGGERERERPAGGASAVDLVKMDDERVLRPHVKRHIPCPCAHPLPLILAVCCGTKGEYLEGRRKQTTNRSDRSKINKNHPQKGTLSYTR
jgi:hypothetical protein